MAVWTSVVSASTAAQARRFAREERQDVNREWTKKPTAAIVRRQPASALPHGVARGRRRDEADSAAARPR